MKPFNPNIDLPQELWTLVTDSKNSPDIMEEILYKASKEDLIFLYKAYEDAKTEMIDILDQRVVASEDTLDDLANSIVGKGKEYYISVYEEQTKLPERETWEELPVFFHLFYGVYHDRFKTEIWEEE